MVSLTVQDVPTQSSGSRSIHLITHSMQDEYQPFDSGFGDSSRSYHNKQRTRERHAQRSWKQQMHTDAIL